MSAPVTRRRALAASAAAALGLGAGVAPAVAAPALSANDARLVELADAYEALDRQVGVMSSESPGYGELICRYSELEVEAAGTPADSLAGVAAKARLCQSPAARGCADYGHVLSAVDDLWRLFGGGRHA